MAATGKKITKSELARRIAGLESKLSALTAVDFTNQSARTQSAEPSTATTEPDTHCAVPELAARAMEPTISLERERLIRYGSRKWVNQTHLHYYFFRDDRFGTVEGELELVREGFQRWADIGIGLEFSEVTSIDDAEIRIGFLRGDGYWSYVGTDVLNIGQLERTMNFGRDLRTDRRQADVAVHEIGHTLGFPHEHQNPIAGIIWDVEAVVDYFSGPPNNWDRATIDHNVLRKIPQTQIDGSDWDPDSIMHYSFDAGLISVPERFRTRDLQPAPGLSALDREQALFFYPPASPAHPRLDRFQSQLVDLQPGEQRSFRIEPESNGDYVIQTFGSTDSVIVLFEDTGDDFVYVAGDDDSGWNRNARIEKRLYADRKYVLRVRLYYQWSSGPLVVMYS